MSVAAGEVTWMVRLLEELCVKQLKPVALHCDNQSAIHIAKNPVHHERTKHIQIDIHFTRDKVLEGLLQIIYLPTESQIADVFTKILPSVKFNELLSKLGMTQCHSSLREGDEIIDAEESSEEQVFIVQHDVDNHNSELVTNITELTAHSDIKSNEDRQV